MMTKPISKRRNLIFGLLVIPMAMGLVSCFGDYNGTRAQPFSDSYINHIDDDRLSVNFNGMNREQLDNVREQLLEEDIQVNYKMREFNDEGIIEVLEFEAIFSNANSGSATIDYKKHPNRPHGLRINYKTGGIGVGHFGAEYDKNKHGFFDKMTTQKDKGAEYYLEDKKVSYEEAVDWFDMAAYWQSGLSCDNPETGTYIFRLSSPTKQSWNPFKINKSPQEKLKELKAQTQEIENELKAKYYGNATIVVEKNGVQELFDNFSQLNQEDKNNIPGPIPTKSDPLNANVILYDVAASSTYTHRFNKGVEVALIADRPSLKNEPLDPE